MEEYQKDQLVDIFYRNARRDYANGYENGFHSALETIATLFSHIGVEIGEPQGDFKVPFWGRYSIFRFLGSFYQNQELEKSIENFKDKSESYLHMMYVLLKANPFIDRIMADFEDDIMDYGISLQVSYYEIKRAIGNLGLAEQLLGERNEVINAKYPITIQGSLRSSWILSLYESYQEIVIDFPFLNVETIKENIEKGKKRMSDLIEKFGGWGTNEKLEYAIKLL